VRGLRVDPMGGVEGAAHRGTLRRIARRGAFEECRGGLETAWRRERWASAPALSLAV
jgi:hypothetical protein